MPSTEAGWTEVEKQLWEKTYESDHGDLLYIKDNLEGQTEIDDAYWNNGRYTIEMRRPFLPEEDQVANVYDHFDDLDEAEAYLDGLLEDL